MSQAKLKVYEYDEDAIKGRREITLIGGEDVEHVTDASKADVFVVPVSFMFMGEGRDYDKCLAALRGLPHYEGNERRHVVYDCIEHTRPPEDPVIYFRSGDCPQTLLDANPHAIAWPWPVEDYAGPRADAPKFQWDCGYIGYNTNHDLTPRAVRSCTDNAQMNFRYTEHDHAWGWQRDHGSTDPVYVAETKRRRDEFLAIMYGSRCTLEPVAAEGIWRYRFFESWSASRLPVHIGDGCGRPFADQIPYDDLALFIPSAMVDRTGELVMAWLEGLGDAELVDRGRAARGYFEKYLDRQRWPSIMAGVVRARLA